CPHDPATSSYGLIVGKEFRPFDEHGNELARAYLAKQEKTLRVHVRGYATTPMRVTAVSGTRLSSAVKGYLVPTWAAPTLMSQDDPEDAARHFAPRGPLAGIGLDSYGLISGKRFYRLDETGSRSAATLMETHAAGQPAWVTGTPQSESYA